jgi:hypothetical protein
LVAEFYIGRRDWPAALAALATIPTHRSAVTASTLYALRALIHLKLGRLDEAEADAGKAFEVGPGNDLASRVQREVAMRTSGRGEL